MKYLCWLENTKIQLLLLLSILFDRHQMSKVNYPTPFLLIFVHCVP